MLPLPMWDLNRCVTCVTISSVARRGRPDPAALVRRLVRARERLALTQQEVADALGVSRVTVARWEAGLAMPRGLSVAALEAWLEQQEG